jgi:hypothetical protein
MSRQLTLAVSRNEYTNEDRDEIMATPGNCPVFDLLKERESFLCILQECAEEVEFFL